jgi:hypothetical protein
VLPADEDILRRGQVLHQVQFLMDDADAQGLGVLRVAYLYLFAFDFDRPASFW